jgi:tRNA(Ile)-lysidine synthase
VDSLLTKIDRFCQRQQLLRQGMSLGVAVSGGADSVCLLLALWELRGLWNGPLHVLHVDHQLRAGSGGDAAFVRELAERLGLPFHLEVVDVAARGGNLEQEARLARLALFGRLIGEGVVEAVATGHTQSDQAETVLFRLLRGTGPQGLAGVLPKTAEGLVRPLLAVTRPEVEGWLRERGQGWVEDSTNADVAFTRNRIRHLLLPHLVEVYNPALVEQLGRTAELARDEEAFWAGQVGRWLEASCRPGRFGSLEVACEALRDQPLAVARRCLRGLFERVKGDLCGLEFGHTEAVLGLVGQREGSGRLQIPGLDVFRSFDWLRVMRLGAEPPMNRLVEVGLEVPGRTRLPDGTELETCLKESGYTENEKAGWEWAALETTGGPLRLRYWLPGDRYQPAEASGAKNIKEMFQLARIPLWERRFWPIIETGDAAIVWSRQFGVAAGFRRRPDTRFAVGIREPQEKVIA